MPGWESLLGLSKPELLVRSILWHRRHLSQPTCQAMSEASGSAPQNLDCLDFCVRSGRPMVLWRDLPTDTKTANQNVTLMTESSADQPGDEQPPDQAFISALVTEHFVLQSASSTTVSEAGSRASLYVFSLSSSLVALGFASQSPTVLKALLATILPGIFLLGCFTVVRLVDTTVENNRNLRAIAHIRRYYRTLAPQRSGFFPVLGVEDHPAMDSGEGSGEGAKEALAMLGTRPRRTTVLYTMASMVASINSLVLGVGVALLAVELFDAWPRSLGILAGAVVALAYFGVIYRYQVRRYSAAAAADRLRWETTT
jgi:hypothetical protein